MKYLPVILWEWTMFHMKNDLQGILLRVDTQLKNTAVYFTTFKTTVWPTTVKTQKQQQQQQLKNDNADCILRVKL